MEGCVVLQLKRVLVVCSPENGKYWSDIIAVIERSNARAVVSQEKSVLQTRSKTNYDLIVIDVNGVSNMARLVAAVRRSNPSGSILIATATPVWQEARYAFYIGATDYIKKTFNPAEMAASLWSGMDKR
jgi:DNA-binding response OmpR family regulator